MYLVSYDIESDKLRRKVAKILENYGKRVQYSVFECELDEKRYRKLYAELFKITRHMENSSIRFYYICANCRKKIVVIGEAKEIEEKKDIIII